MPCCPFRISRMSSEGIILSSKINVIRPNQLANFFSPIRGGTNITQRRRPRPQDVKKIWCEPKEWKVVEKDCMRDCGFPIIDIIHKIYFSKPPSLNIVKNKKQK
jgi:hypothetical protein